MLNHFWKKLFKLSAKEVVKDTIKSEKKEDTPMTPSAGIRKLSELSLSTTSLSSMMDINSIDLPSRPSMMFDNDVWLIEEEHH